MGLGVYYVGASQLQNVILTGQNRYTPPHVEFCIDECGGQNVFLHSISQPRQILFQIFLEALRGNEVVSEEGSIEGRGLVEGKCRGALSILPYSIRPWVFSSRASCPIPFPRVEIGVSWSTLCGRFESPY